MTEKDQSTVNMWRTVERYASKMGYATLGYDWSGPNFKPEHMYLTNEGYPLGSTCWCVFLEIDGLLHTACADTPEEAVERAVAVVEREWPEKYGERP